MRGLDEQRAFQELDRDVDAGRALALEPAAPGRERIDPGDHRVVMAAKRGELDRRAPRVVAGVDQLGLAPDRGPGRSIRQHGAQHVVTVPDEVGLDRERLADHPLDRIATAIDLGAHRKHDDAPAERLAQTTSGGILCGHWNVNLAAPRDTERATQRNLPLPHPEDPTPGSFA
jgi:hypothetical protein